MKICSTCKQMKPLTEFYTRKESKDGKNTMCKVCCNRSRALSDEKMKKLYAKRRPYFENIVKPILKYYNTTYDEIFSSRHKINNIIKIMIYVKLVDKKTSFKQIGLLVGVNHSTVIHHYNKYKESKELQQIYNTLNSEVFKKVYVELDNDIIIKRMANNRKPIKEIAEKTGLTYNTVYRRIKLLIKENGVKKLPLYSGTKNFRKVIN